MTQAHLSTERLQDLHDGEPGHRRELEHLASCPVCQEAFDDSRWTMLLMRLGSAMEPADAHPDPDELLALHTGALAMARHTSILEHLRHCRRCMTEYARTRAWSKRARHSTPSSKILRATVARFRPRTMRRLGRLLVQRVGEGLAMSFLRSPGPMRYLHAVEPMNEIRFVGEAEEERDPASASGRVARMISDQEEASEFLLDACARYEDSSPRHDASIEGSPWHLRVSYAAGAPVDSLQVTLGSTDETRSVAKVTMRIMSQRGDEISAPTDTRGIAVLPCPSGSSRLIVEVEPPLSVEVRFDD